MILGKWDFLKIWYQSSAKATKEGETVPQAWGLLEKKNGVPGAYPPIPPLNSPYTNHRTFTFLETCLQSPWLTIISGINLQEPSRSIQSKCTWMAIARGEVFSHTTLYEMLNGDSNSVCTESVSGVVYGNVSSSIEDRETALKRKSKSRDRVQS